jgi:hypothetical protein
MYKIYLFRDYLEMDNVETTFANKCKILSELWIKYRDEETLKDFFDYNDISLPLAFLLDEGVVSERNSAIDGFIEEAFVILLTALKIKDEGFDNLDDLLVDYFDEGE